MSRDSRLIHTHLHALREHLNAHQAAIETAGGQIHQELTERRTQPPTSSEEPVRLQLPELADHGPPPSEPAGGSPSSHEPPAAGS